MASMDFSVLDADTMFALMDDGDEELTAPELVEGVAYLKGPARSKPFFEDSDRGVKSRGGVGGGLPPPTSPHVLSASIFL